MEPDIDLAAVLGRLGLSTTPAKTHCEAKCRDGHACRRRVIPGRQRCRNHGGMSTGPRTEAGRSGSSTKRAPACHGVWQKPCITLYTVQGYSLPSCRLQT
jgi:hypothetical protein